MILRDLLDFFGIEAELPDYLYDESFNDVFLKGVLSKENNAFKIEIITQKDVIHTMTIDSGEEYPVVISSILPNGKTNGTKFAQKKGELKYI